MNPNLEEPGFFVLGLTLICILTLDTFVLQSGLLSLPPSAGRRMLFNVIQDTMLHCYVSLLQALLGTGIKDCCLFNKIMWFIF